MKKILLGLGLFPFILSSCGVFGTPSFFSKKFVLNGSFNNLDDKLEGDTTNRKELTNNFSKINWKDPRGTIFTDTSSVQSVINEMDKTAAAALNTNFGNYTIEVQSKENGKATVKIGEEVTQFTASLHDGNESVLDLKDSQGYTEYELWNIKSQGNQFQRVGLMAGSRFASVVFTMFYTEAIGGIDGLQVTYYANFLPASK